MALWSSPCPTAVISGTATWLGEGYVCLLGMLICPSSGIGACGSRQHTHWHTPGDRRHRGPGAIVFLRLKWAPHWSPQSTEHACELFPKVKEPVGCSVSLTALLKWAGEDFKRCVFRMKSFPGGGLRHSEVGAVVLRWTGVQDWELGRLSTSGFSEPPNITSLL